MRKNKLIMVFALLLICMNGNAQIFTSNGGYRNVNAASNGEPGSLGQVRVKDAPTVNSNKQAVINNLNGAGIPNGIINNERVLGNGAFANQIAGLTAVTRTAEKLNQRPTTAPTNGAIIINSVATLNANRGILQDNSTRTVVFRGYVPVGYPILVGSNKTIWIDGTVDYNGVDVVPEGGAAFTPRPLKNDGVFSVRHQGSFRRTYKPVNQANIDFNRNVLNVIKNNRKANTTFRGTKRGKIVVRLGDVRDDKQLLPKANGIVALSNNNLTIDGVNIEGALNAIYVSGSFNVNIRNCFTDKTVYRAIHLHGTQSNNNQGFGFIKNNLLAFNLFDGIDIDSFSAGFNINENFVIGARDRLLIWSEIDAGNCTINNNVGIILDATTGGGAREAQAGGYQENGTEESRRGQGGFNGTNNNKWTNNHSFYAEDRFDGFEMRKDRFIQFGTITFTNNYVWTTNKNLHKHNPKVNTLDDVYYLESGGSNNPPTTDNGDAPIGQVISLRKSGGDRKFVTGERTTNNGQLIARGASVQGWEKFRVESHPSGGITLKALSNDKYVQVPNQDTQAAVRANGNSKSAWEHFVWKSKGTGKVAIQSVHTQKWLQGAWNENNGIIRARGNSDLGWETFDWKIESSNKNVNNENLIEKTGISVWPNPVNSGNNITISTDVSNAFVSVYNLNGEAIYQGNSTSINTDGFASGIYIISIMTNKATKRTKLIVQ